MADSTLTRKIAAAVVATCTGLALSACASTGNDDVVDLGTGNNAPAAPPDSTGDSQQQALSIPVSAFDYGYELVAPVDAGTYTFELTNDGDMQHDLVIEGQGVSGGTAIIGSGATDSFTVDLEPGTYTLYCSVGTHRSQGMEFTFTVA
ncbi:cupredoxin domain-containing protein [Demequina sp. SO4-18]|uniref:cupredoxin domain-containing protein n=1 Tax=Demequina sp. SO4-18 TaxID=3401026 RepID=UPI003B5C0101